MSVAVQEYRNAMSRLGAAVNIITTGSGSGRHGFTASAVCSVTDAPPTLLVCMNRGASSRSAFVVGGALCVNTLSAKQRDLSEVFASGTDMASRFDHGRWSVLATGAPVLDQAVVSFDGLITAIVEVGTHSVIFCEIEAVRLSETSHGLIYFNRDYHGLVSEEGKPV